jgi:hypothetical protein
VRIIQLVLQTKNEMTELVESENLLGQISLVLAYILSELPVALAFLEAGASATEADKNSDTPLH